MNGNVKEIVCELMADITQDVVSKKLIEFASDGVLIEHSV